MCIMCDGASRDEVLFSLHGRVQRNGWALQIVASTGPPGLGWVYTIGLAAFDHPELVVVGLEVVDSARVPERAGSPSSRG